jgi:general secretion pathway protein G
MGNLNNLKPLKIVASLVIIICIILVAVPILFPITCNINRDQVNLGMIRTALKMFHLTTKRFPTNSEGLKILTAGKPEDIEGYRSGGYIERLPTDKSGNSYHYLNYIQKNGEEVALIWTFGSDELPGGEDEQQDVYEVVKKNEFLSEK